MRGGGASRWRAWIGAAVVVAAGAALAWNELARTITYEQERVLVRLVVLVGAALALLAWLFLLAPLGWRARGRAALGLLALAAAAAVFVEFRGFTGDVMPILRWRFARETPIEPPATPTPVAARADAAPFWRDFPQFLGPTRDATLPAAPLARNWSAAPPQELWRRAVGRGWSGFAVVGERAITQEQRGEREAIVCYGTLDGVERWAHEIDVRFTNELGGEGPRATPTVAGERVYAVGATGILACLELATGALVWQTDVVASCGARVPEYGYSSSPWVGDGLVVLPPGNGAHSLAAYDAATGERVWLGGDDAPSYASPLLRVIGGVPQLLVTNASTIAGIDPASGRELWDAPWDHPNPNACQPLALPADRVFVSSGYGAGCAAYRIERTDDGTFRAIGEWRSPSLKSKFASYAHHDGFVYGLDDGTLACLDAATGVRRWKGGRYGHGQLLLVGDLLLVVTEEGELVLAHAAPAEHVELARIQALHGKTWNTLALAAPLVLVRNDEEAVCYRLP